MAQKKFPKLKKFTTPKGLFKFPSLSTPDYGSDDYPDPNGSYKVAVVFDKDSPDAKALIAKLEPEYKAALSAAKEEFDGLKAKSKDALAKKGITKPVANALYHDVYDRETDEPTGQIEFRFKRKASGTRKDGSTWNSPRPGLFDAALNKIPPQVEIWGGSEGKVNFEVQPYFIPGTAAAGVSLKLVGAQVIDLVTKGGNLSADQMGFEEEEGDTIDDLDLEEEKPEEKEEGFENEADDSDEDEDEIPF